MLSSRQLLSQGDACLHWQPLLSTMVCGAAAGLHYRLMSELETRAGSHQGESGVCGNGCWKRGAHCSNLLCYIALSLAGDASCTYT